jgi:hypothetical protein
MSKISTNDCQIFLSSYYKSKKIDTKLEKWELIKKYKNFQGYTCRDFYYKEANIKAIVVLNKKTNTLSIIEDQDYSYFLDEMVKNPLFYYVPVITKYGLSFYFVKTVIFDITEKLDNENNKQKIYLEKRLQKAFKESEYIIYNNLITIFNKDFEETIRNLENINFHYNDELYDFLDIQNFIPVEIDLSLILNSFPEYQKLNTEESISLIFNLVSTNKELNDNIYCQIKSLLNNISLEELYSLENIINGFKIKEDKKLSKIITFVINKKKNQKFIDSIINN